MTQEDREALFERLDEIFENLHLSRLAVEHLENTNPDPCLMANMTMIRRQLGRTEGQLYSLLGRPPKAYQALIAEDVPFD